MKYELDNDLCGLCFNEEELVLRLYGLQVARNLKETPDFCPGLFA